MPSVSLFRQDRGLVSMPNRHSTENHHSQNDHSQNDASVSSSQHSTISVEPRKPATLSLKSSTCRSVTFSSQVRVYATIHRSHYSPAEKKSTWLTRTEMNDMKAERKDCIRVMEKVNEQVDNVHHYFRGLEAKTVSGYKRRRFVIVDACMAVMDEQSEQADIGLQDPEGISRAYRSCSVASVEQARTRGIFDEISALTAASASNASPLNDFFQKVVAIGSPRSA